MWLLTIGLFYVEGEGLFFFTLGIWICKRNKNIEQKPKWVKLPMWSTIFITIAAIKTFLAFKGFALMGEPVFPILMILHKLTIFSGLIVVWYGCDGLVKFFMDKKWFIHLSAYSFMIYALHVPLITYLIDPTFSLLSGIEHYRLLTFILLPLAIISFCIAVGWIMRKSVPKVYSILTGGRGF
jgi:membrane-bound acyltransferase YfiQ involved in biofilm formation